MFTPDEATKLGLAFCENCTKLFAKKKSTFGKYCSNKCQHEFQNTDLIQSWLRKEIPGHTGKAKQIRKFVRNYLLIKNNYACQICGWNERHPVDELPLVEIDHIDGNADNSFEDNLRVLCPNHHAMTDTFRARNKNGKRQRNIDGDVPDL